MTLKYRYAAFLLLVTILLTVACMILFYGIMHGWYLMASLFGVLLYCTTYQLGRRFAKIFFVLSLLRLIRKNGGCLTLARFHSFMERSLAGRRTPADKEALTGEILGTLLEEKVISLEGDSLLLNFTQQ